MRSRFLSTILAVAALLAPLHAAFAAWPDKPIRLIVPSAPGGAPDVLMRALSTQLSQQLGVPIVIDNKPGGSYTIGTMELVRSPADGYTLAYGNVVSLATNRSLLPNVPYDVEKDLTLVSNTLRLVNLMVVNNDLPARTVPELVRYAKSSAWSCSSP
jgi:tripartite-type tricarboxylate transporter receptor subunit TctC